MWKHRIAGLFTVILFVLLGDATPSPADELKVAFSPDIPPFVMDEGRRGMEIDIVREALAVKGHTFTTVQYSYRRLEIAVAQMDVDAAAGVREQDDKTYYSENFIAFHNVAITKKKDGIVLDSVADLPGKRILAWQNAYRDLGPEFEKFFNPNVTESYLKLYSEIPIQEKQVEMFWRDRADVIIIDESIFKWVSKQLSPQIDTTDELEFHNIFAGETEFQVNFREERLRDDFNEGLAYLRESGQYQEIIDSYLK